jgi:arylsulfatase
MARATDDDMAQKALRAFEQGVVGGSDTFVAYPVGWANCSNTPFRFYKRTPMNGGIRVPLILSHPKSVKDAGAVRTQWVHVTDTLPTVLEMIGAQYPLSFNGHPTRGLDGCSYLDVLKNAQTPAQRTRQHFELEGNRGMILFPWKIVSLQPMSKPIDLSNWLLFNLEVDPTECDNLAARHPDILQQLIAEFELDAQSNQVYPLDNRDLRKTLAMPPFLENKFSAPLHFYPGVETIPLQNFAPSMADRDYCLEAHFSWQAGFEGVIFSIGDNMGGLCVFVQSGDVIASFVGTRGDDRQCRLRLSPGAQHLRLEHSARGQREGVGQLVLNGVMAPETLNMTPTFLRLVGEGFDVGLDRRRKVSADCEGRGVYRYGGQIERVSLIPGPQAPDSFANRPEAMAQWD